MSEISAEPRAFRTPESVAIEPIVWQGPGDAFLLPISGFPIPEQELPTVRRFLRRLTAALAGRLRLSSEVFVQLFQVSQVKGAKGRLNEHGRDWMPELGLGVWPDRAKPSLWTNEDFLNLGPGEELPPLTYDVFRISKSLDARHMARDTMLESGSVVQIMLGADDKTYFQRTKQFFLAFIDQPTLRHSRFYIPLFERKALEAATPEQLESWWCGASVYIRESFEDKGILIASQQPLTPILRQLGGQPTENPGPHWNIPVSG